MKIALLLQKPRFNQELGSTGVGSSRSFVVTLRVVGIATRSVVQLIALRLVAGFQPLHRNWNDTDSHDPNRYQEKVLFDDFDISKPVTSHQK